MKRIFLYFSIFVIVVLLDQFTKRFMLESVGLNNSKPFIPNVMQFLVVQNSGGAFSIFNQYPVYFKIIGVINVFIFSYLTFCSVVKLSNFMKIGCSLVLGGTVGNLIDRFLLNGVIDFLDLQFINFAVFNLADVFIDLGVILILIEWIRKR
ncbi:MAG: signal peptidase II [Candidatus Melainabacteria bacterium]|nr:signal peptidase II [Candidatus Melainabacteria bacterium]